MAINGRPDAVHQDVPTQLAVAVAAKFVENANTIGDSDFNDLRVHFSEKQMSELCAFMVFVSASHQYGVLMDVGPEDRP
jgi:alkylhydroperoxidase family enzyme